MSLTESQNKAVSFLDGNALINAGAGSGKSTVLIARTAKLIAQHNIAPEAILGLTFTNEAANNMKKRLKKVIGKNRSDRVSFSTFHSFAYRWLKQNFPEDYANKKVIEGWYKNQIMYDIVAEETNRNPVGLGISLKAGDLAGFISYQKANLIKPGMRVIIDDNVSYCDNIDRWYLQKAYDTYCELVMNARVIDFDDMLVDLYYNLKNYPEKLQELRNKYQYIMVDEFQDSNSAMMAILKLITHNNLFVVGDFRQGIYGFINATIDNILEFQNNFDNVELIELADNFRSTDQIVKVSNDLISASPIKRYKAFSEQIASKGVNGQEVYLKAYQDEYIESDSILNEIQTLKEDNPEMKYSDFCVLCRTNAQLGVYESKFADEGVPVDVSTSKSFFDRKEIADLLAYASVIVDDSDDMSLRRIVNSPSRYISKAIINKLEEYAYKNGLTLIQAMHTMDSGNYYSRLMGLTDTIEDLNSRINGLSAGKVLKMIYKRTHYEEFMDQKAATHTDLMLRQEAVMKLFDMAKKFPNIKAFLAHVSVIKNNNNKKNEDAVHLMTVHASKGLEFDTVFVPSTTCENYPHDMNPNVEEERRILYVALSRAITRLYISFPVLASNGRSVIEPSPFLKDIAGEEVESMKRAIMHGGTEVDRVYHG